MRLVLDLQLDDVEQHGVDGDECDEESEVLGERPQVDGSASVAAAVFLMAGVGVGLIAILQIESREMVYALAGANIAGGVLLWLLFLVLRDDFDPGARWAIAAVADSLILIGLLEIFALRRSPASDED